MRIARREATRNTKLRSRRTSVPQASAAIDHQLRPSRDLGALPSRTRITTLSIVTSSRMPEREESERELARGDGDPADDEARDVAQDLHQSDERARHPDLGCGDEVGDIALERALGEVGAELEEGNERRDGDQFLAQRDAEQEYDIEHGADEDVRLAPAPARDGVVRDGSDRRLDDRGDDRSADRQEEQGPTGLLRWDEGIELDAAREDHRDPGEDRGQAEPVQGDPEELAGRQPLGRSSGDGIHGVVGHRAIPRRAALGRAG